MKVVKADGGRRMKTYRELYFRGTPAQLSRIAEDISNFVTGDWAVEKTADRFKDYLFIDYIGNEVEKARVSIYLGADALSNGELKVGNIVPLKKNKLTLDEYNAILVKFNADVIDKYRQYNPPIFISQISSDVFDPLTVITNEALEKLKTFCHVANKATGAAHPQDQRFWFDFICQTVDDNKMFDYTTLANFLQDEFFWRKRSEESFEVMETYAWDEKSAYELAAEYSSACDILRYYKKTRGI